MCRKTNIMKSKVPFLCFRICKILSNQSWSPSKKTSPDFRIKENARSNLFILLSQVLQTFRPFPSIQTCKKSTREYAHKSQPTGVWEYERVRPSKWCRSTSSSRRKKLDRRGCSVSSLFKELDICNWNEEAKAQIAIQKSSLAIGPKDCIAAFVLWSFSSNFNLRQKRGINTLTCDSTEYSPARKDESKMKGDQRSWVKLLMRLGSGWGIN